MFAYLAGFYQISGEDDKSVACLNDAIKFAPDFGYLYAQLAEFYFKKNHKEQAFENFKKAVWKDPYNDAYYYMHGVACLQDENYNEAISHLESAILYYSEDPNYFYALGIAYIKKERHQKAVEMFQKVIELDEHFPEGHEVLGRAYFEWGSYLYNSGRPFESKKNFKTALKIFKSLGQEELVEQVRTVLNQIYY